MCGCNKNKGGMARAMAPAPRSRGISAPQPEQSRPVIQQREVVKYYNAVVRKPHPRNPNRRVPTRERRSFTELHPLEIVDTNQWGAHLWRILHVLSLRATSDAALAAWAFLPAQLDGALPCPECAQHYHDWIREHPLMVTGSTSIQDWVVTLHNQVNERKQLAAWTTEQMTSVYSSQTQDDVRASLSAISQMIGVDGLRALESLIATCYAEAPVSAVVTDVPVTEDAPVGEVVTDVPVTEDVPVDDVATDATVTEDVPVTEDAPVDDVATDAPVPTDDVPVDGATVSTE
jgi:hypothetical protein